jgi:hypothetical protein
MVPINHMIMDRPAEPLRLKMALGVAKIPVPTMRFRMRKLAPAMPIVRLFSRACSR